MKSTLQDAIGLSGDAWLRIDATSGKIERHTGGHWQETGWRFNSATGELEVLLGSVYERAGYKYSEQTGAVIRAEHRPTSRPPSPAFRLIREWLSNKHNLILLIGVLLVVFSFYGFHKHTGNSFPAIPIALCIAAALLATWLIWSRSSMKAALLFILAMVASRTMWLYPLVHRVPTEATATAPIAPASTADLSKKLYQYVRDQDIVGTERIIEQGADPDFPNPDGSGKSPLHLAAAAGNEKIVAILLENGAPINNQDAQGETALHVATGANNLEIVRMLLDHGAATGIRTRTGHCALDRFLKNADKPGADQVSKLLLDAMVKQGVATVVPNNMPSAPGVGEVPPASALETKPGDPPSAPDSSMDERASVRSLANQIKVVPDDPDGMCAWTLHGKTIYSSSYLQGSDPMEGEPSPNGKYIHFGSIKENANRCSPLVFRKERDTLVCLGDITPRVIQAVRESGILPAGRSLDDECFVDVVRWNVPDKLLLNVSCSQRGQNGFTISNFPCLWDIANDRLSYAPSESGDKVDVQFSGSENRRNLSAPDPEKSTGGPMAQGETAKSSISAFLDAYYKVFINGPSEKWAGMFTANPYYCYANSRVSRAKLIAESDELRTKWPSRSITPQTGNFQLSNNGNNATLLFSFSYTYSNTSAKSTSGVSNMKLGLVWAKDRWRIDSFEETVSKSGTPRRKAN